MTPLSWAGLGFSLGTLWGAFSPAFQMACFRPAIGEPICSSFLEGKEKRGHPDLFFIARLLYRGPFRAGTAERGKPYGSFFGEPCKAYGAARARLSARPGSICFFYASL